MSSTTTHAMTEQAFSYDEATSDHGTASTSRPLACDLTAIASDRRPSHLTRAEELLRTTACETQELPDGYAFRFTADAYDAVVAFIADERQCCPFFSFVLDVAAEHGSLWLRITGPEGVKDILHA